MSPIRPTEIQDSKSGIGHRAKGLELTFSKSPYALRPTLYAKINKQKLLRILDANFNRAKEGLRVCEDVCRFILDDRGKTRQFKMLRHRLSAGMGILPFGKLLDGRNIDWDVGKSSTSLELKRKNIFDIFYANMQRSKESLRVLEEFAKLLNRHLAEDLKKIRYQIYALEKKVIAQFEKSLS